MGKTADRRVFKEYMSVYHIIQHSTCKSTPHPSCTYCQTLWGKCDNDDKVSMCHPVPIIKCLLVGSKTSKSTLKQLEFLMCESTAFFKIHTLILFDSLTAEMGVPKILWRRNTLCKINNNASFICILAKWRH